MYCRRSSQESCEASFAARTGRVGPQVHRLSQRRVARLLPIERMTLRYEHHRDPQEALRIRLRELAGSRVRYGYRRLTVLLRREGWDVNAKRIYRLYTEEGLIVRTKKRKERAQRQRVAHGAALRPNQGWSMDFVAQRLADSRWVRVLTVVDQFTRECLCLHADTTLSGEKVAAALDMVVARRGAPESITVDNVLTQEGRASEKKRSLSSGLDDPVGHARHLGSDCDIGHALPIRAGGISPEISIELVPEAVLAQPHSGAGGHPEGAAQPRVAVLGELSVGASSTFQGSS